MAKNDRYHHGDLRRVVLAQAVDFITDRGVEGISLRELARRAGVSYAAPAHHFGDKRGLFTAIAIEGHQLLADALMHAREGTTAPLKEQGVRYVEFAERYPAHFEVMFRPDLLHGEDPHLLAAQARSRQALRSGVDELPQNHHRGDPQDAALAAWALAHGFAALRRSGNLDRLLRERDPSEAFRVLAGHLFTRRG